MTDHQMQLHDAAGKRALTTPNIKKYQAALREATKIERRMFTDAIQAFCEYVDHDQKCATAPERAYSNFTRQVYAAFGLNKKQIEARLNDEDYGRDHFEAMELLFVQSAERAATQALLLGMSEELKRDDIKVGVKLAIANVRASYGYVSEGKMYDRSIAQ